MGTSNARKLTAFSDVDGQLRNHLIENHNVSFETISVISWVSMQIYLHVQKFLSLQDFPLDFEQRKEDLERSTDSKFC